MNVFHWAYNFRGLESVMWCKVMVVGIDEISHFDTQEGHRKHTENGVGCETLHPTPTPVTVTYLLQQGHSP